LATLTSAPDRFIFVRTEYARLQYLARVQRHLHDTVRSREVSEGVAGCLVIWWPTTRLAYRFLWFTPGNGDNGTNDYTLRRAFQTRENCEFLFPGTGVLDNTRISQCTSGRSLPKPTITRVVSRSFAGHSVFSSSLDGAGGNAGPPLHWATAVPCASTAPANFVSIASGQFHVNVTVGQTVGTSIWTLHGYTLGGTVRSRVPLDGSAIDYFLAHPKVGGGEGVSAATPPQ